MVENQHKKIKGYRDLSEEEISLMNEIKEKAEEVGELINKVQSQSQSSSGVSADMRWSAIAKTTLQQGFMALVRSIAKPESF